MGTLSATVCRVNRLIIDDGDSLRSLYVIKMNRGGGDWAFWGFFDILAS